MSERPDAVYSGSKKAVYAEYHRESQRYMDKLEADNQRLLKVVLDLCELGENNAESIDGEHGTGRSVEQIRKDGDMPEAIEHGRAVLEDTHE